MAPVVVQPLLPTAPPPWLSKIDLRVGPCEHRMGLRQVGPDDWLDIDASWVNEVAHKAECATDHPELELVTGDSSEAASELLALLKSAVEPWPTQPGGHHPLVEAGRRIAPDICLMNSTNMQIMEATLLFANQWTPQDKIGQGLLGIHAPVEGYDTQLSRKVEGVMGRLGDRVLVRRNWFIHDVDTWCIPEPLHYAEVVERPGELTLRSERQTLRRLPKSGVIVFMIRTQQVSLGVATEDEQFRAALVERLEGLTELDRRVRHLEPARAESILSWLRATTAP